MMKKVLLAAIVVFIVFQMIILYKQPLLGWDEAVYAGMAKYIASSGNIGLWEDLRPLGLPILLSIIWKLPATTATHIIFSKILMILIAAFCLLMTHKVEKNIFNGKTAILATIILATTPIFIFNSNLILTELLSTLFGLTALYFFINSKYYLTGIFTAIAFLTKFPQGILLIAFTTPLFFSHQYKNIFKIITCSFVATLPFFIFNFASYGNIFHTLIAAAPHQNNPTFSIIDGTIISYLHNTFYYLIELFKQNILLIFAIPALFRTKHTKKNQLYSRTKINGQELSFRNLTNFHSMHNEEIREGAQEMPKCASIGISRHKQKTILYVQKSASFAIVLTITLFIAYFTIAFNKQVRFSLLFLPYFSILAAQGIVLTKNNKIKAAVITIFVITFVFNAHQQYAAIKTTNEPIMEFYTFFNKFQGQVLTTNPIPAAYSDKLFVPFYQDIETAHKIYDAHKNTSTIAYTTEFYPCSNYADLEKCELRKKELVKKISNTREKVYSINYGQEYIIYSFPNASLISRVTKPAV